MPLCVCACWGRLGHRSTHSQQLLLIVVQARQLQAAHDQAICAVLAHDTSDTLLVRLCGHLGQTHLAKVGLASEVSDEGMSC